MRAGVVGLALAILSTVVSATEAVIQSPRRVVSFAVPHAEPYAPIMPSPVEVANAVVSPPIVALSVAPVEAPTARSTPSTTVAPPRAPKAPVSARSGRSTPTAEQWAKLRQCESGGAYDRNTGNGYYGAYQFSLRTWANVGGTGNPAHASAAEQDMRAQMLYERAGRGQWPACGRYLAG